MRQYRTVPTDAIRERWSDAMMNDVFLVVRMMPSSKFSTFCVYNFFHPFFIEHAESCSPKLTRTQRTSWWTTSWWTAFRVSLLNLRLRDDRRGPVRGVASSTRDHDMLAIRDQWPYNIPVPLGSKQRGQVSTFINSARPPKQ